MPLRYAVDAAFGSKAPRTLHTQLPECRRPVNVRLGTIDLRVLEQVLARQEYSLPKSVKPRTIVDVEPTSDVRRFFFANRYPDARIIAVDPEPSNCEVLQSNCAGLPSVIAVPAAVSSHPATLTIVNPVTGKWACSMKGRATKGLPCAVSPFRN
jgi:hypothetical protein